MDRPSQRIAAALRARIEAGDLRPGERVPSVRALVRDWGVAHATAARAVEQLRREGMVTTRPRSGSVVAVRSGTAASPPPEVDRAGARSGRVREPDTGTRRPSGPAARGRPDGVDRERVVSRALTLADEGGLAAVSLRALAAESGMPTMSLHRLVGGKDELVRAMIDAAFARFPPPRDPPTGWRAGLEATAWRQWEAYRRHPWLAQVVSMTRPQAIDGLLAHADHAARSLEMTDLDAHDRLETHLVLFVHVRGMAAGLAAETAAEADTGVDADTWAAQADPLGPLLATGRYPALARMAGGDEGYPFDLDRLFEAGLRHTLDGFAVQIRAARRRSR